MSYRKHLLWFLLCILCLSSVAWADSISRKDFYYPAKAMQGEERYEKKFSLGVGVSADVTIDVTAKGNGYMSLLNLRLKVFDEHDDGAIYEGGLLHIDFVDLDGDGFKDLVISGLVIYTGEKETSPRSSEPVVFIYHLEPKQRKFKLVYKRASFDLTEGPPAGGNDAGSVREQNHK